MEIKFGDWDLSKEMKRALEDMTYVNPTEIQVQAIPEVLKGSDLIAQSQTGTGKTASFGIPIVENVDPNDRSVQAIVLCPTRELAMQIADEIRKYVKYKEGVKTLAVYGGQDITRQIRELKRGVQIVIGTPGRVMDHMKRKTLKLEKVKTVVLDEADEMLNMGFEEDIVTILKDVPVERQTVLFSATMNPRIRNIAKKYLNNPVNIKIQAKELVVENIDQILLDMKQGMKNETLTRLIDMHKQDKIIVFCNTKRKVEDVIEFLKQKGYRTEGIHGDIKQIQRERIIKGLKTGKFEVLVATDVVARGIDIEDLGLVINYDIPQEDEYYVHRIGRTGRNGRKGKAFTFVVGKEKNKIYSIQKYANTKLEYGKIPTVTQIKEVKRKEMIQRISDVMEEQKYVNEDVLEEMVRENYDIMEIAKALMTICSRKSQLSEQQAQSDVNGKDIEQLCDQDGNIRFFLNVGKKDNIMAKDIVGSMAANTAVAGREIGKINVLDKFSFVDVPYMFAEEIMVKMKGKQIKGKDVVFEIAKQG